MSKSPSREAVTGQTAEITYRIRVSGILDEDWSRRSYGMAVVPHRSEAEGSYTELIGVLPDEAALMGLLDALYGIGAKLQSVEMVDKSTEPAASKSSAE